MLIIGLLFLAADAASAAAAAPWDRHSTSMQRFSKIPSPTKKTGYELYWHNATTASSLPPFPSDKI
jgi:hypothetical protein